MDTDERLGRRRISLSRERCRALERGAEWQIQPREWVPILRGCMICGYKERERGRSNRGRRGGEGGTKVAGL